MDADEKRVTLGG